VTAISGKHSRSCAASMSDCKTCKGTGWIRIRDWFDPTDTVPDLCHDCDGSGNADDKDETDPYQLKRSQPICA
jgi:DnaJ-class molecular chaperone